MGISATLIRNNEKNIQQTDQDFQNIEAGKATGYKFFRANSQRHQVLREKTISLRLRDTVF